MAECWGSYVRDHEAVLRVAWGPIGEGVVAGLVGVIVLLDLVVLCVGHGAVAGVAMRAGWNGLLKYEPGFDGSRLLFI